MGELAIIQGKNSNDDTFCKKMSDLGVVFTNDPTRQQAETIIINGNETYIVISIMPGEEVGEKTLRAAKLLRRHTIIFFADADNGEFDKPQARTIMLAKWFMKFCDSYTPTSLLEISNLIKGKYCSSYTGCCGKCNRCKYYPANWIESAIEGEQEAFESFINSSFRINHPFTGC